MVKNRSLPGRGEESSRRSLSVLARGETLGGQGETGRGLTLIQVERWLSLVFWRSQSLSGSIFR